MKRIVRTFIFVLISLNVTQYIMHGFFYGTDSLKVFLLIGLALSLLFYFLRPILALISLPVKGLGFLFLTFVMAFITLYILTLFIPSFYFVDTTLTDLNIFGFVLPSKSLTSLWSGVFSALILSAVYTFLEGLCSDKK